MDSGQADDGQTDNGQTDAGQMDGWTDGCGQMDACCTCLR